jgi:hypothetical protein
MMFRKDLKERSFGAMSKSYFPPSAAGQTPTFARAFPLQQVSGGNEVMFRLIALSEIRRLPLTQLVRCTKY